MHFGEYELFPGLIGLSPLPTVHPKTFQRSPVRTSIPRYRNFILTMGRSPGFRVYRHRLLALFRLALLRLTRLRRLTSPVARNS